MIHTLTEHIKTKEEFLEFMSTLIKDYTQHQEDWENDRLDSFLYALQGYLSDCPSNSLEWESLAEALFAARTYE